MSQPVSAVEPVRIAPRGVLSLLTRRRVVLTLASWFYAAMIHLTHITYLNPVWDYYGFTYRAPGPIEFVFMAGLVTLGAALMPMTLTRASSIIVLLLFVVVYVPTTVITLGLDADRLGRYGPSLLMLGLGFAIICIGARRKIARPAYPARMPVELLGGFMLTGWLVCLIVLLYTYWSIMSFAGWDEIYEQRLAGASSNLLMGYVQTYFSNVFSPALLALGLIKSHPGFVFLGIFGCLVSYMINAMKAVFFLPIAMVALYFLLRSKVTFFRTSAFAIIAVACMVVVSLVLFAESPSDEISDMSVASWLTTYLVFRALAIPGLAFSQYYDLFSTYGFTWWSHVKGLDFIIPAMSFLAGHPSWPELGRIVGERVYFEDYLNQNASLFSGDGVAAAGAFGVLAISIVCAIWLSLLDRASRGWDSRFVILVSFPVGVFLTNGQLFTVLASFGGLFWLLVFSLLRPRSRTSAAQPEHTH